MTPDVLKGVARAVSLNQPPAYEIEFSVCSLVTDADQYCAMVQSMVDAGFDESCAEYLYLDNRASNQGDGFSGLNSLANRARGRFVLFCHQDLLALDGPDRMRRIIAELTEIDPDWAVLGNAGLRGGERFMFLNEQSTVFVAPNRERPELVESLDENFLVLRQEARLGFSGDLSGFHLYGTDLVTQARLRGLSSYVVDFRCEHFGRGKIDGSFHASCDQFERKYSKAFVPRSIHTTCTTLDIGTLKGEGRKHRLTYFARGGHSFVRPSKKVKKLIRSRLAGNMLEVDGIAFRHPQDITHIAYHALRKGYYELPERQLMQDHLPSDLPVVELGGSYGVVSGLINRKLNSDQRQVIVEANPALVELCRENALRGGADRELCIVNCAIDYSGAPSIAFNVTSGTHDSHVVETKRSAQDGTKIDVPTMTLSDLLAEERITTPYSLICDIEGAEYDLVAKDASGLANCQMMVIELHPSVFYERGDSTSRFLHNLAKAGFDVIANEATVIAARRNSKA